MLGDLDMIRTESAIIKTHCVSEKGIYTYYRLLHTVDAFQGRDVYSVFLTTSTKSEVDEEFAYDIAQNAEEAILFFTKLCNAHVTACTLLDVTTDFLASF